MWKVANSKAGNYDKCVKHEESGAEVILFGESGDDHSVDVDWTALHQVVCDYLNANEIKVVLDGDREIDVRAN